VSAAVPLPAFACYGLEIEYAIVDRATLDVRPLADRLLAAAAGHLTGDHDDGAIAWSNELSLHVIELKTNGPAPRLAGLAEAFAESLGRVAALLAAADARLLPGPMHPWMDPLTEQRLWPHGASREYQVYDRIFDCRGHGWANLQSMHLNLPFAGESEFVRLHTAIRALLPLMPALAAGSPFMDGAATGFLDTRLEVYRLNQRRVPEITGRVIPECVAGIDEYHARILEPMYAAIAPLDPEGALRGEWLNSRGAIARFERDAIEIRVLDAQECPNADLAIAHAVSAVLRDLYEERHQGHAAQAAPATARLAALFERVLRDAERTVVDEPEVLVALGVPAHATTAGALWRTLLERAAPDLDAGPARALAHLLAQGPLARRLLAAAGPAPTRARLVAVYRDLCAALDLNRAFGEERDLP
jgi:gamma-glutamyl:cysteine ligase YbdK (ATP-grasp superfamily)